MMVLAVISRPLDALCFCFCFRFAALAGSVMVTSSWVSAIIGSDGVCTSQKIAAAFETGLHDVFDPFFSRGWWKLVETCVFSSSPFFFSPVSRLGKFLASGHPRPADRGELDVEFFQKAGEQTQASYHERARAFFHQTLSKNVGKLCSPKSTAQSASLHGLLCGYDHKCKITFDILSTPPTSLPLAPFQPSEAQLAHSSYYSDSLRKDVRTAKNSCGSKAPWMRSLTARRKFSRGLSRSPTPQSPG